MHTKQHCTTLTLLQRSVRLLVINYWKFWNNRKWSIKLQACRGQHAVSWKSWSLYSIYWNNLGGGYQGANTKCHMLSNQFCLTLAASSAQFVTFISCCFNLVKHEGHRCSWLHFTLRSGIPAFSRNAAMPSRFAEPDDDWSDGCYWKMPRHGQPCPCVSYIF